MPAEERRVPALRSDRTGKTNGASPGGPLFFINMLLFINKEIVMQKRFCTCGHAVLVTYVSHNGAWKPRLVANSRARRRSVAPCCPGCGAPLDINRLR